MPDPADHQAAGRLLLRVEAGRVADAADAVEKAAVVVDAAEKAEGRVAAWAVVDPAEVRAAVWAVVPVAVKVEVWVVAPAADKAARMAAWAVRVRVEECRVVVAAA